jgi:hypothetical protein
MAEQCDALALEWAAEFRVSEKPVDTEEGHWG